MLDRSKSLNSTRSSQDGHWHTIRDAVGGYPFLDTAFDTRALTSIALAVRWTRGGKQRSIQEYLRPDVAHTVYAPAFNRSEPFLTVVLSDERLGMVQRCIDSIVSIRPEWRMLFQVPVLFGWTRLTSSMHPAYPQQVLLGDGAFESFDRLRETLVHEYSHIWYGMMGEVAPFQRHGESPVYTLPSGTKGRDTRSVVTAAAFAACVLMLFRAMLEPNGYVGVRRPYLRRYLQGTCDTLALAPNLSESGAAVFARLRELAHEEALADERYAT